MQRKDKVLFLYQVDGRCSDETQEPGSIQTKLRVLFSKDPAESDRHKGEIRWQEPA